GGEGRLGASSGEEEERGPSSPRAEPRPSMRTLAAARARRGGALSSGEEGVEEAGQGGGGPTVPNSGEGTTSRRHPGLLQGASSSRRGRRGFGGFGSFGGASSGEVSDEDWAARDPWLPEYGSVAETTTADEEGEDEEGAAQGGVARLRPWNSRQARALWPYSTAGGEGGGVAAVAGVAAGRAVARSQRRSAGPPTSAAGESPGAATRPE
ncbi:hypothetical protein MNEG_12373, partial [Monoraphidium neglectum]